MQRLWSEISIVLSEEFRRNIRRKQYLIITFTPVVIVLVLALAMPLVRGLFSGDSASAASADGGRAIAVVNDSPNLTFALRRILLASRFFPIAKPVSPRCKRVVWTTSSSFPRTFSRPAA